MIGLLTHLSTALNQSEAEAAALLNAFVRDVHHTVRSNGEAVYPGLGVFRMGPGGQLDFRPDASLALVVNHRFAGLTPVPVQPSSLPDEPFAASPTPGAAAPAGWMPPTSPLDPPRGPLGGPEMGAASAAPSGFAPPVGGFAPPPETPPVVTTPYIPPIEAIPIPPPASPYAAGSTPYAAGSTPYGGASFTSYAAPLDPYVAASGYAPSAAGYTPPPSYTPPAYVAPAATPLFTEPAPAAMPPHENAVVRERRPARRVPWSGITLGLLVVLGLITWYVWATSPQVGTPGPNTPPATIITQNDPGFTLPPPDSVPPESLTTPVDSGVPAPTTPVVDPGASAADPVVDPAASAPASSAAPSTTPAPSPSSSTPSASAGPSSTAPSPAPAVRRNPSPYTPYTGSSRPDRTVRRSPPRRPYTGRTYRSGGGRSTRPAARPAETRPAPVPTTPPPRVVPTPRPETPPATYEVGLTPELEQMLLGEEAVQPGEGYTIVVKGEPTEAAALEVAERYRTVGYRVNVLRGLTSQGAPIYRVVIGQFDSLAQVQRALRTLAGEAFPPDAWMLPLAQ